MRERLSSQPAGHLDTIRVETSLTKLFQSSEGEKNFVENLHALLRHKLLERPELTLEKLKEETSHRASIGIGELNAIIDGRTMPDMRGACRLAASLGITHLRTMLSPDLKRHIERKPAFAPKPISRK